MWQIDKSAQTVQMFDKGLHCLPFSQHFNPLKTDINSPTSYTGRVHFQFSILGMSGYRM